MISARMLACAVVGILLLSSQCAALKHKDEHDGLDADVYDYVVIGAGSGGAVVASGLSDDLKTHVLLIEGGPNRDNDPNVREPSKALNVVDGAYYNWDYQTEHVKAFGGRRTFAAGGRMWGGSSSHNLMFYVRGNDYDYKRWAPFGGDQWSVERVKSVFKQMENNSLVNVANKQQFLQYHGVGGRLDTHNVVAEQATFQTVSGALHDVFDVDFNPDYNGATQEGFSNVQFTQQYNNGAPIRESSSTAYLSEDIVRVNKNGDGIGVSGRKLTVYSYCYATKLISRGKVVRGVEYIKDGVLKRAYARYDIIVSAGALVSPAILMRSGIGNCTELADLGIDCVLNNPHVGKNLTDQLAVTIFGKKDTPDPLPILTGAPVMSFYKSSLADQYTDKSISGGKVEIDSQFLYANFIDVVGALDQALARKLQTIDPITGAIRPQVGFSLLSILVRPKCTSGRVSIPDRDPLAAPVIEAEYACDPYDLEWANRTLDDLIAVVKKMTERDPSISLTYPTPDLLTPEYRDYTLRTLLSGVWHYTSSLSMGKVVDRNLCVKGLGGLRVVDASAIPFVTSGNTNAPVMMLAKNAVDIIRATKSCKA